MTRINKSALFLILWVLLVGPGYSSQRCPFGALSRADEIYANRAAPEFGGFAYGMSPHEILDIANSFATEGAPIFPIAGKQVETILFNASHRSGFWEKAATIIRDIDGSHLFNDANHRITYEIVLRLMARNGIVTRVSEEKLYHILSKVGRNAPGYKTVDEIAAALRGY